jgi:hypothetical protein
MVAKEQHLSNDTGVVAQQGPFAQYLDQVNHRRFAGVKSFIKHVLRLAGWNVAGGSKIGVTLLRIRVHGLTLLRIRVWCDTAGV